VAEIDEHMLKRTAAFFRSFADLAWFFHFDWTPWRQMQAAIERHDLSDRGLAEIDAIVLF
jgi:hypothetical protein